MRKLGTGVAEVVEPEFDWMFAVTGPAAVAAEQVIPEDEDLAIVAVGFAYLTRVVHLVEPGCHQHRSEASFEPGGQPDIGVRQQLYRHGEQRIHRDLGG